MAKGGIALDIPIPRKATPILQPARTKALHGGRGSAKSHTFAGNMIECHMLDPNTSSVCLREVQKSLKFSVKRLLEQKISDLNVGDHFKILDTEIRNRKGDGIIIFEGMQNHNADSIKSLEGFDRAWFSEAQNASQYSLDILRPTLRKHRSELWFDWNPKNEDDPIDLYLRRNPPPDAIVIEMNYWDNPWFYDTALPAEMESDKVRDYDKYLWIWEGKYQQNSEARVFHNWKVEEFDTDPDAILRFGADWGFASDPSVLVRSYIKGKTLYVDYEAYAVGCDIVLLPDLFDTVPDSRRWPIIADSARPETISHMRQHGFPKILPCVKGKGSIEDGIEFLKSYDIVVHPRCTHTIDELSTFSYKVDPQTQMVLPVLADKKNHVIDALRYSHEGGRRAKQEKQREEDETYHIPSSSYSV